MRTQSIHAGGATIPLHRFESIVIGTGCAGYNAADWLYELGKTDVAILTEGVNMGTSRNTGSDKQTYYKLSLASDGEDSVAQTLFDGGSVNGDTALAEAACSVRSFIKLANLGVPFPTNIYGEYVGYKTDHDPRQRATSAGPLTSRYMTQALQKAVKHKNIPVFDGMQVIRLLVRDGAVCGVLALDCGRLDSDTAGLTLFFAENVILATGGPAGIYSASVYPESQTGSTGMALEAGAVAANLQEWQYGLASTQFRWNVSGTYQQVLPRYIAVDKNGCEREFLPEYFSDPVKALDMVFLKGYQWPFDVRKVNGSSIIDIIVHHETVHKGNRVYMDFTREPAGLEKGFDTLCGEAYTYLKNSGALLKLPIERLRKMNPKAIELYQSHGIDITHEPLEVAVCAQHCNGGIDVDTDWQSNIRGLYVVGEAAGTFGVYRPGGSALNSTQVGSLRAAEHIAYRQKRTTCTEQAYAAAVQEHAAPLIEQILALIGRCGDSSTVLSQREHAQKNMSRSAAHLRDAREIEQLYEETLHACHTFFDAAAIRSVRDLPHLLKNYDILLTQAAVLCAMQASVAQAGSRGSGLVLAADGQVPCAGLEEYRFLPGKDGFDSRLTITQKTADGFSCIWQPVRPIPKADSWFETVWDDYNKRTGAIQDKA